MKDMKSTTQCSCGSDALLKISVPGQPNFGFKPYISENIDIVPTLVESRTHKKELMKKNNIQEAA